MNDHEAHSSLELALGGACPVPKLPLAGHLLDLPVTAEVFDRLLRHWSELPARSRPRLRGLGISREAAPRRQLLLEAGGKAPFLLISVDAAWPARSLVGIWSYAAWWEEELRGFEGVSWGERGPQMGVQWQRA